MISGISSSSPYLTVVGGVTGYPYISPGSQSAGMMRWNISSNVMEVYNGVTWIEVRGSHATVDLNGHAQSIMRWAEGKMKREAEAKELAEKYDTVATALTNIEKAEEQLELAMILAKDH
jgi:hypothetical protein